jgi:hypothetical protein
MAMEEFNKKLKELNRNISRRSGKTNSNIWILIIALSGGDVNALRGR